MESNRRKLIEAIKSKDKVGIFKALQSCKPIMWIAYTANDCGKLEYDGKEVSKDALEAIIMAHEKEYQVNLIKITTTNYPEGTREENFHFEKEASLLTLDLSK